MVTETITNQGLLIDGQRAPSTEGKTFPTYNPATGDVLAQVAEADAEDVDRAVRVARRAFDSGTWPETPASARGRVLLRAAALLRERAGQIGDLEMRDNGKPIGDARDDVVSAAGVFEYYAGAATRIMGETIPVTAPGLDLTLREPLGVCAQIVPWNFPILMASWKLAPALAAGCTVVLKPAEQTPMTALVLGELLHEAGVPNGVVNVLPGFGETTGQALISHPLIDKIAFTGSTEVGKIVMHAAAEGIKRVSLELGGKSPNIVFDDVDIERVAAQSIFAVFGNAGQDCTARTRFFVHERIVDRFTAALLQAARALRVGDPRDESTQIGALISPEQQQRVEGYISLARDEGADVACGGSRPDDAALRNGNFLLPTVLVDVRNHMRVAREEIFGPVVGIIPFGDEAEVIAMANDTPYGLSGTIWTRDIGRAIRLVRSIRTGVLSVNTIRSVHIEAPFGGYKQSGLGRELGKEALELYTEVKNVFISME
ncbi:MAG: aldehyde dehydrogenase family protein [Chloroflexota bacterium]